MDSISIEEAIDFATTVGRQAAELAQTLIGSQFGRFLLGVWIVAALVHVVWAKVRRG